MAAGPTKAAVSRALTATRQRLDREATARGLRVTKVRGAGLDFYAPTGEQVGSAAPRVLRASNGEAFLLIDAWKTSTPGGPLNVSKSVYNAREALDLITTETASHA